MTENKKIDKIEIFGVNGLLSNIIHFIDLVIYLFDCKLINLNSEINEIYQTKRNDYLDFNGKFESTFLKNNYNFPLTVFSLANNRLKKNIIIKIFFSKSVLIIKEDYNKFIVSLKIDSKIYNYPILYQSKLSQKLADNLQLLSNYPTWNEISSINKFIIQSIINSKLYNNKIKRALTT